jgi:hypothetical protein
MILTLEIGSTLFLQEISQIKFIKWHEIRYFGMATNLGPPWAKFKCEPSLNDGKSCLQREIRQIPSLSVDIRLPASRSESRDHSL